MPIMLMNSWYCKFKLNMPYNYRDCGYDINLLLTNIIQHHVPAFSMSSGSSLEPRTLFRLSDAIFGLKTLCKSIKFHIYLSDLIINEYYLLKSLITS